MLNLNRIPRNIAIATTSVVASLGLTSNALAVSFYLFGPTVPSPYSQAGANQWCGQQYNALPWSVATNQYFQVVARWKEGDGGVRINNPSNIYADMQKRRCVAVTN